jgi:hypothetical protein
MNWGKSIIAAFILFGAFIATLVTICVRQDINLVTKDYYREELEYQRQIDRIAHTAMLSERPSIKVEGGGLLKIIYPDFARVQNGALELFRPSDARMDRKFELKRTKELSQFVSTAGMIKGMYRARLRWTMNGEEFFLEQVIYL